MLADKANKLEKEWTEYGLPNTCIQEFVFDELFPLNTSEYELLDILSRRAIESIIDNGVRIVNANRLGKELFVLGARGTEAKFPTHEEYEKLFSDWEQAGWISICGEDTISISIVEK